MTPVERFDTEKNRIIKEAAQIEIQQGQEESPEPGVFCENISFSLTADEAYICLKNAGIFKTSGKRAVIYTVLMAVAAACFFFSSFLGQNYNWLIFGVFALLVIAVIWIVPHVQLKKLARENAKGNVIKAAVFADRIEITGDESTWNIPLDQTSRLSLKGNMLIFHTENGQLFAIPERAVEAGKLEKIKHIVQQGTRPYEH